jgi:hypothetical protein
VRYPLSHDFNSDGSEGSDFGYSTNTLRVGESVKWDSFHNGRKRESERTCGSVAVLLGTSEA